MKKALKLSLLPRIAIAIAAGLGIGLVAPDWLSRLCATFNEVFGQFLNFLIPLIILGFVTPAIGDIGKSAGKMLVATALLAYVATLFAGFTSYFTCNMIFPSIITADPALLSVKQESAQIAPWFTMPMPPALPVMTALVLAFLLGLGIAFTDGCVLKNGADEFRSIIAKSISKAVIPLLPFYI